MLSANAVPNLRTRRNYVPNIAYMVRAQNVWRMWIVLSPTIFAIIEVTCVRSTNVSEMINVPMDTTAITKTINVFQSPNELNFLYKHKGLANKKNTMIFFSQIFFYENKH